MSALKDPENQSENIDSKIRAAFNGRPYNCKRSSNQINPELDHSEIDQLS